MGDSPDALVSFTRSALAYLLGGVAITGILSPISRAAAAVHAATAAVLLLALVTALAFTYARASYRARPWQWAGLVGCLALALGMHASGSALVPGEGGAEGRAHLVTVLPTAALGWATVLALHALTAVALAGLLVALLPRKSRVRQTPLRVGAIAAAVVLLPAVSLALVWPDAGAVPVVDGAEAARAPWVLRALEPLETWAGVPAALAIGAFSLALVALLPLLDRGTRPAWLRGAVSLGLLGLLVAYAGLTLYSGLTSPLDHLHAGYAEVSP